LKFLNFKRAKSSEFEPCKRWIQRECVNPAPSEMWDWEPLILK